jgi:hypothetical protein
MNNNLNTSSVQLAGYTTLGGTILMLVGAALWGTSGTIDLWTALDSGDMAGYLATSGTAKGQLVANLTVWIVGVLVLGVAGAALVDLDERRSGASQAALMCVRTMAPLVVVSYIAMMSLVVQVAPDTSATSVAIADVVGWIGARADDLGTALIIGFTPLFISLAGRGEWMPGWLAGWGFVAGAVGLFSLVVLYIPGMAAFGFVILPVGLGWMLAAGVVLLRRG